ncbi:hypothetical protein HNY73_019139 [Argiope bruennichi]|uniref:Uncharacterized protein n=1 Tax=Argiope bruennichi TaxID=94029 RepID=A0A8T0EJF2_ARGBR|nr:hypothetical protein HNY73_019139 [Argiope bruennichi]
MLEHDRFAVSRVPDIELTRFANTLYSYLYYHLNMQGAFVRTSDHFQNIIGTAVFRTERTTYKFNNKIFDGMANAQPILSICKEICRSFRDTNYFRKLYYVSAFILDYVFWRYRLTQTVELNMGPDMWKRIFRRKFESLFERNGGWQAFAEAGVDAIEYFQTEPEEGTDMFLEDSLMNVHFMFINMGLMPNPLTPEELSVDFEDLSMEEPSDSSPNKITFSEDIESSQTDEELNLGPAGIEEPSASTSKKCSGKNRRKRRHDPATHDSDSEDHTAQNPFLLQRGRSKVQVVKPLESTPEKPKESTPVKPGKSTEKSRQKRRHEGPTTNDSDEELVSPSSSKAKVDRK